MADDDYSALGIYPDEDEYLKNISGYAPAVPAAPDTSMLGVSSMAPPASADLGAPAVSAPAGSFDDLEAHAAAPRLSTRPPAPPAVGSLEDLEGRAASPSFPPATSAPPAPQWKDYAPAEPHGWGKAGRILTGIFAPQAYPLLFPQERQAEERYKNAVAEHEAPSLEREREATTEEREAQTEALRHPQPKPKEETWKDSPYIDPSDNAPLLLEQNSGTLRRPDGKPVTGYELAKQPQDKTPAHITVMHNGKPHIMERDDKTGKYSIDRGEAPPSYAMEVPQTRTTELLGSDGVMHRFQWNENTQRYDIDMGAAPTGAAAHSIFQAGRIEDVGGNLIKEINANRDMLGNLESYYKQWMQGTPVADPKASMLLSELMSFAALQPALHGFRSHNAMEAFETMIGGLAKNPDATIATIQGILKTAGSFDVGKTGGGNPNQAQSAPLEYKSGLVRNGYEFQGGDPTDKNNWKKIEEKK